MPNSVASITDLCDHRRCITVKSHHPWNLSYSKDGEFKMNAYFIRFAYTLLSFCLWRKYCRCSRPQCLPPKDTLVDLPVIASSFLKLPYCVPKCACGKRRCNGSSLYRYLEKCGSRTDLQLWLRPPCSILCCASTATTATCSSNTLPNPHAAVRVPTRSPSLHSLSPFLLLYWRHYFQTVCRTRRAL